MDPAVILTQAGNNQAGAANQESETRERQPAVYILASKRNGTLYAGVTSDLVTRVSEHKKDVHPGFTKRYRIHRLVYCEFLPDMPSAISREKQIKKWNRAWKVELIEEHNPEWRDLAEELW